MDAMVDQAVIRENYLRVLDRISAAAAKANRRAEDVRLVVVTKGQPLAVIESAIAAGASRLGENYPEEGVQKISALSGHSGVEWHMIGHVQSRKAKMVCENYTYLHSLDSLRLANKLDRLCAEIGRRLPVLLELNVSGEESKSGFTAWTDAHWEPLLVEVDQILKLPYLELHGLMTIAPYFLQAEQSQPYYHRLQEYRSRLAEQFPQADWSQLSMGMSLDFEAAIPEGATFVRVGQAILGPRPKSN